MTKKPLHLNAFLMTTGHHEASWRLPESDPQAGTDIDHYINLAQTAERGGFDSIFFADGPSLRAEVGRRPAGNLEPLTLLAALAVATERIGLIATASTSYNSPYNLARRLSSIDHISRGRVGWNIVTTAGTDAARNFGLDELPAHKTRYERAEEFLDVVQGLWQSWDADAILADKEAGAWGDDSKVHALNHEGRFFKVAGPLNVPRSPQVYPLLVQAGSSDSGKELAGKFAEAVFTAHQNLEDALAFYQDVKARAVKFGRNPDHVKILPGIVPVIGATEEEARAKDEELNQLIRPEYALAQLAQTLRIPPDDLQLDRQLPDDLPEENEIEGAKSRYTLIVDLARREALTVRELIGRLGGGRGHRTFAGTPEQVADAIEEWFNAGAADGFNIMPPALPSGLEAFVDTVIPILRERGLFRHDYEATTLRGHYGLPTPEQWGGSVVADSAVAAKGA
ncbi:LLM class flavin-dependent oxidoreductase [Brevibacterium sp. UCMA 11754]|uniref:LLM class flavin-dependent oxidoreductase n=1 Tax=Brevibacterium sp. UCMA 11754 TaxID=2749198 RepID=UPI001F3AE9A4|nr:LLM class flavin-dependent oxidoreductase [Brevibacterium sp. UCMA 11754]MCF2573849.1 LLM class flavin-dependent oxidoreductase [Brevibacterium sp. UCMA 11754]